MRPRLPQPVSDGQGPAGNRVGTLSNAQALAYLHRDGVPTRLFRGNWWFKYRPWFFSPLPILRPLPATAIARPDVRAIGYRAVCSDPSEANVATKAVLFTDLAGYDAQRVSKDRRRELRRALTAFEYHVLTTPDPLLAQGWGVASRAAAASGHTLQRTRRRYEHHAKAMFGGPGPTVVAAFDDNELVAYMTSLGVGDQASLDELFIAPHVRRRHAGVGLYWHTLRLWAQVPGVNTAYSGLAFPEQPGLDAFKITMGARVCQLPTRVGLAPPARAWLSVRKPAALTRWSAQHSDE